MDSVSSQRVIHILPKVCEQGRMKICSVWPSGRGRVRTSLQIVQWEGCWFVGGTGVEMCGSVS